MFVVPSRGSEYIIPEEFKEHCDSLSVTVSLRPFPNPGNPYRAMRLLEFKNYSTKFVDVQQYDRKAKKHIIPASGSLQIMLAPDEMYPTLTRQ